LGIGKGVINDDPYGDLPGMTAAEKASALGDSYGLPQTTVTPAGQRAREAMAAASAGPGGMMSPEYKSAYKQSSDLADALHEASAMIQSAESSHSKIERAEDRPASRRAALIIENERANLLRIQNKVGATSTSLDSIIRASRLRFIRSTR